MSEPSHDEDQAFLATLSASVPLEELESLLAIDDTITIDIIQSALERRAKQQLERNGAERLSTAEASPADSRDGLLAAAEKAYTPLPMTAPPTLPTLSIQDDDKALGITTPLPADKADLKIRHKIGEGGMGLVHEAIQCSLQREVAIKTLKQQSEQDRHNLLREAMLIGQLEHPNIIPIYTLGQTHTRAPLVVMKRIDGVNWRELIHDPEHPFWEQAGDATEPLDTHINILMQVCNAVSYAHAQGVVHLDIKPSNVMLGSYGEVYLLDWGIAMHLDEGEAAPPRPQLLGTPAYMAPEMLTAASAPLDQRTDVYLLGATLHELVLGFPRHRGNNLAQVLTSARRSLPVRNRPGLSDELLAIINQATAVNPKKRYPTVQAFRDALANFIQHRGANRLCAAAESQKIKLFTLLADAKQAPSQETEASEGVADLGEQILSTFRTCHMTYQLALQEWPESKRAQIGLQLCLESMVGYALEEGDLSAATQWHSQLPSPAPALQDAIQRLRQEQQEEQSRIEAAKAFQQELDLRTSNDQRYVFFGSLSGIAVLLFLMIFGLIPSSQQLTVGLMVALPLGVLAVYGSALFFWRKRLLKRIIDRRLMYFILVLVSSMLLNRLFGLVMQSSVHMVFVQDLLTCSILCMVATLSIDKWFGVCALLYFIGACAGITSPDLARWSFGSINLFILFFLIGLFRSIQPQTESG